MRPGHALFLAAYVAFLPACLKPNPGYCEKDADCLEPGVMFCDVDGEYPASDFIGKTCIPSPFDAGPIGGDDDAAADALCEPGAFIRCEDEGSAVHCDEQGAAEVRLTCGDEFACSDATDGCACEPSTSVCEDGVFVRCDASGQVTEAPEECALGCTPDKTRCVDVNPSNGLAPYLDQAADGPEISLSGAVINTDSGTVTIDGDQIVVPSELLPAPTGGVAVRVFAVKSLHLDGSSISGTAAAAFVSDGDIVLTDGLVVAAGAMPRASCSGGAGAFVDGALIGSGGGGFGTSGGDGGSANDDSGAAGGGINGTANLVPLRGGCSGGGSTIGSSTNLAVGGGAIQLVSRTEIRFATDATPGIVVVRGSGGRAHFNPAQGTHQRGFGGGSGGGILLEAPRVVVPAGHGFAANGGGGAGNCGELSGQGAFGSSSSTPAPGGECTAASAGDGGDGAGGSNPAQAGRAGTSGGGGGGGGFGRIRINVAVSGLLTDANTLMSPAPSVGQLGTR